MEIALNTKSIDDYRLFLKIKQLPRYRITGRVAWFPDEYASRLGIASSADGLDAGYQPIDGLFDYQCDIARIAIRKRRFAVFADCGLGKTLIMLEFARHVASVSSGPVLIVSPLMVISQTLAERDRWYGNALPIERVRSAELQGFLDHGSGIGITNYDAIRDDLDGRRISGLILDESSMLKSHYGKWGTKLIDMGRGCTWKLSLTGTPAPNDRIEYANQALFVDASRTTNEFLARFFVNKGQANERWIMKSHAVGAFYRFMSDWAIFLARPSTYGWQDNCLELPPIRVHIEPVELTSDQTAAIREETGMLFAANPGGIVNRSRLARIAKGHHNGAVIDSMKPAFIAGRIKSWCRNEQTIVWCRYNDEQALMHKSIKGSESIEGATIQDERERIIDGFKAGRIHTIVTKPKILGFGLNLQMATRQVFSTLQDSYEEYYQAIKRSNRYGASKPLDVHLPVTDVELPMVENVIRKANMVQQDTEEQENYFREFWANNRT